MKKVLIIWFYIILSFILIPSAHAFKFAVISDVRAGSLDNALEFIVSRQVDFIMLPGDFYYDAQDYYTHFVVTNQYWDDTGGRYTDKQSDWINQDLAASDKAFKFVFGHEPAFPMDRLSAILWMLIRGIAEMTLAGNGSIDDYSEMAANTIEECDKLIEIINTMIDITETEAGVGPFKSEKIDICKLIL